MKRWLIIILSAILLTLIIYPSAFIFPKDTLPDRNDTRLLAYIIGQVQDNLIHHQPLFYGRFFAPEENTLAYSDLFLTSSLITLPFQLFTDSPIIIFNLAFIINSVLTICVAYLLFSYLFKNHWIATITTLIFFLSGYHLHYYAHLQIFSLWLYLLSIYFFLRFQITNRPLFLILFFLTVTAQIAESIFPAYLTFFTCLFIFLRTSSRTKFLQIFLHSLPFVPLWILLIFPYIKLQLTYPEAIRPIRDAAHFSLDLEQIFTFYHSWTVIVLFALSVGAEVMQNRTDHVHASTRDSNAGVRFLRTSSRQLLYFSILMSLGPVVKLFGNTVKIFGLPIPLPYTLFYYLFPGFTGFRTPSRFIVLALFSGCVLIGYFLLPLFSKIKTKSKIVLILTITAFLLFEADLPLKGYPVNINLHPVYQEVKALPPEAVILELPILLWNSPGHEIESIKSLYTLEHRHRRLGGFSGFATNSWIDLVENINANGLNQNNIKILKSRGVTHFIENNRLYPLP